MLQIKNTLGGGKPEGLYAWKKNSVASEVKELKKIVSTLPFNFKFGCAVVLNGELHILGSNFSGNFTKHYKWDGSSWKSVSTLPYNFYRGSAVVLNGEIHILGSENYRTKHYKWSGTSWTEVSTLPYEFYDGCAVVYNNEIHILGSTLSPSKQHYKWNGSEWVRVSTLPYVFYQGSAVVLNGEIHILGSGYDGTSHYKWNGSTWTSVSTLPYTFYNGSAVAFDNDIYILGSVNGSYKTSYCKWNGNSWTSVSVLPYEFYYGCAVVFDNGIHILGSGNSSYSTAHYLIIGRVFVYTFLDYVVSDKETAYPDGGEKGGYYYEKVGEGAKISTGSITNSEAYLENLVIEHGLGKAPTKFIVMANLSYSGTNGTVGAFYNVFSSNKVIYTQSSGVCGESSDFTVSDTTVTVKALTSIGKYWADKTYYWIAIVE